MRWGEGMMVMAAMVIAKEVSAQASVFRGRLLISSENVRPSQLRVILEGLGTSTPASDGSFTIAIPSGTRSVMLRIEAGTERLQVTYPRNPVNVPLDANAVTDVVVGPTLEKLLADALGPFLLRLEANSRAAGMRGEAFSGVSARLCRISARSLALPAKNMSLISAASFGRIARLDAIRSSASVGVLAAGGSAGAAAIVAASGRGSPGCGERSPSLAMISTGVAG